MLRRLALEAAAWYVAPAVFLVLYVGRYLAPRDAMAPHLSIVAVPLVVLWILRITVAACLGARAARMAGALAGAAFLAVLLAYYALALIGLNAWGRVVSWELVAAYGSQLPQFAEALGFPLVPACAVLAAAVLCLFAASWLYLGRFDWAALAARAFSSRFLAVAALAAASACALEVYRFIAGPLTDEYEPLSLTLYPLLAAHDLNGHAVDRLAAVRRDAAEDDARRAYRPAAGAHRRNLILIVVDALRADHMGVYGYARDTTPRLAALVRAGRARVVPSVRAACSSSMCGLLAISGSRFVHQFSERPITLPEVLRRHGYSVHMILAGDHTTFYGLKQAYGAVDSYFDARAAPRWRYMNDDRLVLEGLTQFGTWDRRPVMMQIHLMSAHALGTRDPQIARYAPAMNYALAPGGLGDAAGPRASAVNFYDNGVIQADAMIGAILDLLGRKGYLQETVVAITGDHGEALGEHGFFQHANSVREEVLQVPFILLSYGYPGTEGVDGQPVASQVDIAPTLLHELDLPVPRSWQGLALQQLHARRFVHFQERWEIGVFDTRDPRNLWKYWFDMRDGREFAFNLTLDPGERVNAIAEAPGALARDWRAQVIAAAAVGGKRRPGQDPE